jgi:hypothetical protein
MGSTTMECVCRSPFCPACQIFSFLLDRSGREDVSRHRPAAARARKPPFLLSIFFLQYSYCKGKTFSFYFIFGRWRHIFPKSTRDRCPSTSRAACRSTSRRAYATGYAPALPVHYSSRTRSSLAKAGRGTIGRKAVRLFLFSFLVLHSCSHCIPAGPVYTDGMLILRGRFVYPSFSFLQVLNLWILSW